MTNFKPKALQEEPPPSYASQCQSCELSKQRQRVIWGEGNPNARIFFLMDNPGLREDKEGNAFVCGTRETLQLGIKEVGLDIDSIYVSYLLKCRPIRTYNKQLAREACLSHLQFQLLEKKPYLLLGLGNAVAQSLFPDIETDVKSLRGEWHIYQGIPVAFSYHPLAVRRRPNLMKSFIADLLLVAEKNKELQELNR